MSNIQVVSDIHLEHGGIQELMSSWVVLSDTLIMSGDIVPVIMIKGKSGQCKLIREFFYFVSKSYKNVFWVMGNHDYWGNYIEHTNKNAQDRMFDLNIYNIHVLNNTIFSTPEFVIFGSTLWTSMNNSNPMTSIYCSNRMNDYGKIKKVDQWLEHRYIQIEDTIMLHNRAVDKLKMFIDQKYNVPKIAMFHHAPSYQSVPDNFRHDTLCHAYASNLDDLIYGSDLTLVTHGHIHTEQNYVIGKTKVVCNPHGYFGSYEYEDYSHVAVEL